MKTHFTYLSMLALMLTACDQSSEDTGADNNESSSAEVEQNEAAAADAKIDNRSDADAPPARPQVAPRVGDSQVDALANLTDQEKLEVYTSKGIPGIPQEVSDKIVSEAIKAASTGDQVQIIAEQANAWRRIEHFREKEEDLPDHRKRELLFRLYKKHGESWKEAAVELDRQLIAHEEVMKYRLDGIPGLSDDESFDVIMQAIERHSPDYEKILAIAKASAQEE